MKVLGVVCSPRIDGNTQILVKEALNAALEVGAETELLNITDKNIKPCDACGSCRKAHGKCKIEDDMQEMYTKLLGADGIILGTPVYFANVSGQAKIFIDRTYALLAGHRLRNKVLGGVAVVFRIGGSGALQNIMLFSAAQRMIYAGSALGFGIGKGDVMGDRKGISQAKALGKSVVKHIQEHRSP